MAPAFLLPPGAHVIQGVTARAPPKNSSRVQPFPVVMSARRRPSKQVGWLQIAAVAVGGIAGSVVGAVPRDASFSVMSRAHVAPVVETVPESDSVIPLDVLGIKRDDFCGERELRRRKTTQYSEAEEEIMDLDEYEVATQWFRDLRLTWAAFVSIGGLYVLYKGGVMWENWIQEQEKKDMEEEIELTGTFIDPRAVRKEEDEDDSGKKDGDDGKPDGDEDPPQDDSPAGEPTDPSDGLESLEKLFGKS